MKDIIVIIMNLHERTSVFVLLLDVAMSKEQSLTQI